MKWSLTLLPRKDKITPSGLMPLVLRLTINRQTSYYTLPYQVKHSDWDEVKQKVKPQFPNSMVINAHLKSEVAKVETFLVESSLKNKAVTATQALDVLRPKPNQEDFLAYFIGQKAVLEGVQGKATLQHLESVYNKIKSYKPKVLFSDVTPAWLAGFEQYCRVVKGNGDNAVWNTFKILRKVWNLARRDKITAEYPFAEYENPKYVQPMRAHLTVEEVDEIEKISRLDFIHPAMRRDCLYFLLSCYSGLRYQDWKGVDIPRSLSEGVLPIQTEKTKMIVNLHVHPRLKTVLERLLESGMKPTTNQKMNERLKEIAKMASITKEVSCHVGRHTFAVIGANLGIPSDTMKVLLGHSSIKTTMIYYKMSDPYIKGQMQQWDGWDAYETKKPSGE